MEVVIVAIWTLSTHISHTRWASVKSFVGDDGLLHRIRLYLLTLQIHGKNKEECSIIWYIWMLIPNGLETFIYVYIYIFFGHMNICRFEPVAHQNGYE